MNVRRLSVIETVSIGVLILLAGIAFLTLILGGSWVIIATSLLSMSFVTFLIMRYSIDPDRLQARQSERILRLAARTLPFMRQGLAPESAQEVCKLLLPATLANAVAITDQERVVGFAGAEKELHPIGSPIVKKATLEALEDGELRVVSTLEDIDHPQKPTSLKASVIVPMSLHDKPVGILKFYYRSEKKIDETQKAMAEGLGNLLSMQLSLAELDAQRELATQMELRALQAQINPHFLFNTINTIASLIRTNPGRARVMLREFAVFYRRTLEGSQDLITLEQEYLQTLRYLGFEIARFGEERIMLTSHIESGLEKVMVPAFIIQPLVENAVGHAMRDNAALHIDIRAEHKGLDVVICVQDDGVGIPRERLPHMLMDTDRAHMGVALKNVDDRLKGYFGGDSGLEVFSELGVGTTVCLTLRNVGELKMENVC